MNSVDKGAYGERIATRFLKCKGYVVLERNWYSRFGEIDIVAKKGTYLTFVEVKYRKYSAHQRRYPIITKYKLMRMRKTIYAFMKSIDFNGDTWRISALYIYDYGNKLRIRFLTIA